MEPLTKSKIFMIGYPRLQSKQLSNSILQTGLQPQKPNCFTLTNRKKYLGSYYGSNCNTLDGVLEPFMKSAMDRNILTNLGHSTKISETKKRRRSSSKGGKSKRRKSSGGKKGKSKRRKSGRRRRSKKA
ncbi:hypothetical protein TNCT_427481 [Trichonephila clavata]|uniref:Uncharacterized protein n=1 Tax=Trichonephila clavata TaxID=2740835 RepID=A0A8X6EZI9_TRICU|nr:hypothetical protein TNCT_427481 [Trichonephila clavata]